MAGQLVPDVIGQGLRVLFVGANPGSEQRRFTTTSRIPAAASGKHFSGFTPRVLLAEEEAELRHRGAGLTNLVHRPTATAGELTDHELQAGAQELTRKVCRYRPDWVAILGIGAYRIAFRRPTAALGRQSGLICRSRVGCCPVRPVGMHISRFRGWSRSSGVSANSPESSTPGQARSMIN